MYCLTETLRFKIVITMTHWCLLTYVCINQFVGLHDDVIKWKHFPRYWPFVRGIHRSPVNSSLKGQWRGASMFSLICAWIDGWVNKSEGGDLRHHCAHYDVIVMYLCIVLKFLPNFPVDEFAFKCQHFKRYCMLIFNSFIHCIPSQLITAFYMYIQVIRHYKLSQNNFDIHFIASRKHDQIGRLYAKSSQANINVFQIPQHWNCIYIVSWVYDDFFAWKLWSWTKIVHWNSWLHHTGN